jgi:hypothetical protein
LKAEKIFKSDNIRVVMRIPNRKHLDVNDEVDREELMKILKKEWASLALEVETAMNIIRVDKSNQLREWFP